MKKKSLVFWSGLLVACLMLSGGVCLAQGPAEEEGTVSIDPYGYGFEAPTPDVPFSLDGETLPKLAQSLDSYYYLDEEGGLVSWDRDEEGSLGRRVDGSPATPGRMDLPGRVVDLVTDSSMNTNLAVLENGEVYAWGRDYFGILPGNEISLMPEPVRLELPEDLRRIAISPQLLTVLRADGSIEYCGVERGTLLSPEEAMDPTGVVEQSERNALQVIDLPAEAGIRDIKNGMAYRLFLTDSGEVWIDGFLVNDLLYREPTRVNFPEAIVQLGCQDTGYLALGMSGALYFHGLDRSATVGLEIPADGSEPRFYEEPVEIEKVSEEIKSFACSLGSVIARTRDDRFLTWGYNPSHLVSDSDAEYVAEVSVLDLPESITSYSLGMSSGLALTDDGSIYGWGSVGNGLFPDAVSTASYTPREIVFEEP